MPISAQKLGVFNRKEKPGPSRGQGGKLLYLQKLGDLYFRRMDERPRRGISRHQCSDNEGEVKKSPLLVRGGGRAFRKEVLSLQLRGEKCERQGRAATLFFT